MTVPVINLDTSCLPEWSVPFAYLLLNLFFSAGKLVITVQARSVAASVNECDLPVAPRPQWNINQAGAQGTPLNTFKHHEHGCGAPVYSSLTLVWA